MLNDDKNNSPIVQKIEELNEWQEQQMRVLQDRQNEQRRQLELEQKNMYEVMGFLEKDNKEDNHGEETNLSKVFRNVIINKNAEIQQTACQQKEIGQIGDYEVTKMLTADLSMGNCSEVQKTHSKCKPLENLNVFERLSYDKSDSLDNQNMNKPKCNFLKRGQGLKQRFKVDPDEFQLKNLPKYKYANAHPHLRSARSLKNLKLRTKPINHYLPLKTTEATANKEMPQLELQEKRFRQLLISSKNVCNSTPDSKVNCNTLAATATNDVHNQNSTKSNKVEKQKNIQKRIQFTHAEEVVLPKMSWAKVLDPQNVKPIAMQELRRISIDNNSTADDTDNLNIFELLEQRAQEGSINLNESCIARFIGNNLKGLKSDSNNTEVLEDDDAIPVGTELRHIGINPKISQKSADCVSLGFEDCSPEEVINSKSLENCSIYTDSSMPVNIFFSNKYAIHDDENEEYDENVDEKEDYENNNDDCNNDSGDDDEDGDNDNNDDDNDDDDDDDKRDNSNTIYDSIASNNGLFQQFKEALFSVLNQRASKADAAITDNVKDANEATKKIPNVTANQTPNVTANETLNEISYETSNETSNKTPNEIPSKATNENTNETTNETTNATAHESKLVNIEFKNIPTEDQLAIIVARNETLKREVAVFKDANTQLTKLKQEFELEKALFEQERQESLDELNDIKVKFEMYMHDERIKFDEDKRKLEQQIRTQRLAHHNKERREVVQLREEVDKLQQQIRNKDLTHAAAQTRLRAQIAKFEKDQKHLLEEIDQLRKDNKKLETDCARIERESNNKMLEEINKNIAKLAPKLTPPPAQQQPQNTSRQPSKQPCLNESLTRSTLRKNMTRSSTMPFNKYSPVDKKKKKNKKIITPQPPNTPRDIHSDDNQNTDDEVPSPELVMKTKKLTTTATSKMDINSDLQETIKNKPNLAEESNKTSDPSVATSADFKREIVNPDGSKDIWYSNGNLKKISADRMHIRMLYYNKDIKETDIENGTVKYYYAETNTWHTTYVDGLEILEFPNGQTEYRHKNGTIEVHFPNSSIKIVNPADEHKEAEWRFEDGTQLVEMRNGDKILTLANGQKEIHTKLNKRREYPDGTVKIVYPDGSQETRYSNGRVRLKDRTGKLLMDSDTNAQY